MPGGSRSTLAAIFGYIIVAGALTGYLVVQLSLHTHTLSQVVLAAVALSAFTKAIVSLNRQLSPTGSVAIVARRVYLEVRHLVEQGCTTLVPEPASDHATTVHLLIEMRGAIAVITQVGWDVTETIGESRRQYEVGPEGQIIQRITSHDASQHPMLPIQHQLEYLLGAMRSDYSLAAR